MGRGGVYREASRLPAPSSALRAGLAHNGPMPEGDTIARTAAVLRAALRGRRVTAARAYARPGMRRVPDLAPLVGRNVSDVEALGKHLLIGFDGGLTLRTHLRMSGSWHRYRPGEAWRRPRHEASAVLRTPQSVAVAFNTPVVELLTEAGRSRSSALNALGPDLLAADFDADEAVRRLRATAATALGDALLDQHLVAGIGNVYKSEVPFLERLSPWTPLAALNDEELYRTLATARRLLAANLRGGRRVTTGSPTFAAALWVYARAGRPCRRCGTPVLAGRQGPLARMTYWCPRCQPTRHQGEDVASSGR